MAWSKYEKGGWLDAIDATVQPLVQSLFDSILEVKDKYIHYVIVKGHDGTKTSIDHVERVFSYELYHQWRSNEFIHDNPQYLINAEISKCVLKEISEKETSVYYPDMVLHGGQDSGENYIICEIKRKERIDHEPISLTEDLNKLGLFLHDSLKTKYEIEWKGYKYGVFILTERYFENSEHEINGSVVENNIDKQKIIVTPDVMSHIICVIYNGREIKYTFLNQLI